MFSYILKRILLLLPTFIGITIVSFGFVRVLPGDPVLLMAGERGLTEERYAKLLKEFGYDRPIWEQYFEYLGDLLHGDLGNSLVTKKPVVDEFFALFPATVELAVCAIIIAIVIGIPAGIIAASKRGSFVDQTLMGTALVGYSMPIFWWGLLLIIVFSGWLQWTPVSGRISLIVFLSAGNRLHADRQPVVRAKGGVFLGCSAPHSAINRTRHDSAGGYCAPDPFGNA